MKYKMVFILPALSVLAACSTVNVPNAETKEWIYPVKSSYDQELSETYHSEPKALPKFVKTAEVPQTQVSAKNVDVSWVKQQNPKGTTILIASDDQPLPVSMSLMDTPKDQRSAALKYDQNGKPHYSGVYGSYTDKESAELALNKLPENLKSNAKVVNWSDMQQLHYD